MQRTKAQLTDFDLTRAGDGMLIACMKQGMLRVFLECSSVNIGDRGVWHVFEFPSEVRSCAGQHHSYSSSMFTDIRIMSL